MFSPFTQITIERKLEDVILLICWTILFKGSDKKEIEPKFIWRIQRKIYWQPFTSITFKHNDSEPQASIECLPYVHFGKMCLTLKTDMLLRMANNFSETSSDIFHNCIIARQCFLHQTISINGFQTFIWRLMLSFHLNRTEERVA